MSLDRVTPFSCLLVALLALAPDKALPQSQDPGAVPPRKEQNDYPKAVGDVLDITSQTGGGMAKGTSALVPSIDTTLRKVAPGNALIWRDGNFYTGGGKASRELITEPMNKFSNSTKSASKAIGIVGKGFSSISIGTNIGDSLNSAVAGDTDQARRSFAKALTGATCMAPYVGLACAGSAAYKLKMGIDPVEEGLTDLFDNGLKEMGSPCYHGNFVANEVAQQSDECANYRMEQFESAAKRRKMEEEFNQAQDQNAQAAAAAAAVSPSADHQWTTPSSVDDTFSTLMNAVGQGILMSTQNQTPTAAAQPSANACNAPTQLGPDGCHIGHNEQSHPGGCKCGP